MIKDSFVPLINCDHWAGIIKFLVKTHTFSFSFLIIFFYSCEDNTLDKTKNTPTHRGKICLKALQHWINKAVVSRDNVWYLRPNWSFPAVWFLYTFYARKRQVHTASCDIFCAISKKKPFPKKLISWNRYSNIAFRVYLCRFQLRNLQTSKISGPCAIVKRRLSASFH